MKCIPFPKITKECLKICQWQLNVVHYCQCHLFSSVKRLHGVFKSPNFPSPYPPQTDCIIYLFQGLPFQIVQLTFLTLDLSPPRIDICFDYVAVLHNDRTRLVDRKVADSDPPPVLCGTLTMQKKRTFFSESNSLALVFHSTTRAPFEQSTHMSGFQGNFLFLNSSNFRVDGDRLPDSKCSYLIQNTPTRRLIAGGRIVSPRYPNDYPPNIRCSYTFMGRGDERVVMSVQSLLLSHRDLSNPSNSTTQSCIYETSLLSSFDRVLVHSLPSDRWREANLLIRICGTLNSFQIISEGPNLQLTFISLPFRPKDGGFLIEYVFVKRSKVSPRLWTATTAVPFEQRAIKESVREFFDYLKKLQKVSLPKDAADEVVLRTPSNTNILNSDSASLQQGCNAPEVLEMIIDSHRTEEGVLTSPRFPELYPKCVNGTYYFRGRSGQRVFLKFVLLELGDYERCDEATGQSGDRLYFYDGPSIELPVQLSVCGSRQSVFRPETEQHQASTRSLAIASSGSHFTMLFISDEFVGKFEFGFRLEYRFQHLITWEMVANQKLMANNSLKSKKEQVVYFNYHLQTLSTSPTSKISTAALNLYIIFGYLGCFYGVRPFAFLSYFHQTDENRRGLSSNADISLLHLRLVRMESFTKIKREYQTKTAHAFTVFRTYEILQIKVSNGSGQCISTKADQNVLKKFLFTPIPTYLFHSVCGSLMPRTRGSELDKWKGTSSQSI
ncbi:cubilin [Echinococcus multilocularis]|uniref:Cubilin n=1 Tax=Echinococcus multilocularis TaxID=6211 RepID=A0A068YE19_ECHMU|nr:cubilin [Echinococcus multilocularis]